MHSSIALTFDEAGIFKDAQVFRDGRKRNGERFSQIGDATFGPSQKIEDPASGRIGQGSEDGIERRAVRMLNHMVKYATPCASATRISWYALRDSALYVSTPLSFLLCESAHGPGQVRPFLSSSNVRARIARERVPTTHNCGSRPFRVRARIARERVPTTHNCGSRPFRVRARIARERVPTTHNCGSRPFRVRARIARERVPTPHNWGSRPFRVRRPDRAGARPYHAQLRIMSLSLATPDRAVGTRSRAIRRCTSGGPLAMHVFRPGVRQVPGAQPFDEKEACRNQEHGN